MKEKKSDKIEALLSKLSINDFLTGKQIAEELGVSIKTVRSRIAEVSILTEKHGAQIISKPRYGYQIQVSDQEKWNEYLKSRDLKKELTTGSAEERLARITLALLTAADYIKVSDFADELFVSPQIISDTLKECEKILGNYSLHIERKPYYGLRLIGGEFDKRNCIISSFPAEYRSCLHDESMYDRIFETLIRTFHAYRLHLAEVSLEKCAAYVCLSLDRYHAGFRITDDDRPAEEMMKDTAYAAAHEILCAFETDISEPEIYYLAVYISAMRSNDASITQGNLVITQQIDRIVSEIFDTVRSVFGISFHDDLPLRMMMAKHLLSLDLRIRYHIPLQNSVYLDLRSDFPFAYAVADEAVSVLAGIYQTPIDPSELDWFAVIFASGLQDQTIRKLNVLIVCQAGPASFRLLEHLIRKHYSEHISTVRIVTAYELDETDLSGIDFIFSTVEIRFQTAVPILMVDELALFQKSPALENELRSRRMTVISRFFSEDMFFPHLKGSTKEEILSELCRRISEVRKLPDNFHEALMIRERTQSTDYIRNIAVPHPENLTSENDIVAVAILEHPVFWGKHDVQVLLLTALSLKHEAASRLFYEVISHFTADKRNISTLLRKPNYETFISLLESVSLK